MKVQILTALGLLSTSFCPQGEVLAPVNPATAVLADSEAPKSILDTDTEDTYYARVSVTCQVDEVLDFRKLAGKLLTDAIDSARRDRNYQMANEFQGVLDDINKATPELVTFLMVQTHTVQDLRKFSERLELLYRRNRADTSRMWRYDDTLDHTACIWDAVRTLKQDAEILKK